jgi:hypothetical protein
VHRLGLRHAESFFLNPQYLINVTKMDADGGDGLCTIICACLQKYTRQKRQQTGAQQTEEFINLRLYRVSLPTANNPMRSEDR